LPSTNYFEWHAKDRIPGLVHSLNQFNETIYYSGCKTIRYTKHGTWGRLGAEPLHCRVPESGLICNIVSAQDELYGFTQQGLLLRLLPEKTIPVYTSPKGFAIYEGLISSNNKLILVGHGEEISVINQGEY